MYTVRLLSFMSGCAERILRTPSGGHPQKHSKSRHVVYLVLSELVEQYLWFVAWHKAVCESLITDVSMEQRLAIKFCFKAGNSTTETLQMTNASTTPFECFPMVWTISWWTRRRWRRPQECRNDNNVEKISQLLLQNHHLSLRMLADEVNIGKDTVRKMVVEDLRKRKICSRFVPHLSLQSRKPGELQLAEIWFPQQIVSLTSLRRL